MKFCWFLLILICVFLKPTMSKPTLYCKRDDSKCWRVLLYMNTMELPCELKYLDYEKSEHKTSEFRRISPKGILPVLLIPEPEENTDVIVVGSYPIIQFLESKNMEKGYKSKYKEEKDHALALSRIQEIDHNLYPAFAHFLHTINRSEESSYVYFEKLLEELDHFDGYLEKKQVLATEPKQEDPAKPKPEAVHGLEDVCLFPLLYSLTFHYGVDINLFHFKNLKRYMDKFSLCDPKKVFDPTPSKIMDLTTYQKEFVAKGYGRELVPKTIKISKYDLSLEPDMEKFEFLGEVDCHLEFLQNTSEIILNSKEIKVKSADLILMSEKKEEEEQEGECEGTLTKTKLKPHLIDYDEKTQRVYFCFSREFKKGEKAILKISYDGIIGKNMTGLYRSKYKNKEGKDRYMAATQFEAVDARKCLPCIDEPAHKSVFECKLILSEEYDGLSNMDVIKTEVRDSDKKNILQFAPTVPMSTYLLAFAVFLKSDYGYVEAYTTSGGKDGKGGLRVRVWSLKPEDGQFALETTVKGIPLYEEYFEEKFPLMKLDLLAVSEFAAGAMENWGLITFRETAILLSKTSAAATKERVATVVIHEVAHMWFGNLVTMEWWVDLWLNEGFATWCQFFITDQLYPEMKVWTSYITSAFVSALSIDSLESSHPIEVHVSKAEQVDEIFDTIAYRKGCAVVKMIIEFLGIESFRKGICRYLKEFKYGNAVTVDLWRILQETSGKDVQSIMEGWTKQTGYPFVTVKIANQKEDLIELELSQKRFISTGIKEDDETVWPIPISYKVSEGGQVGPVKKVLMKQAKMNITIPLQSSKGLDFIFFNPGLTGFYRVLYDDKLFEMLTTRISELEEFDRFAIQGDYTDFMKVGLVDFAQTMDLLRAFKTESCSLPVINGISTSLSKIYGLVKYDPENATLFHKFGQEIFSGAKEKYGGLETVEGFSHTEKSLQSLVVSNLVSFLDPDMVSKCMDLFKNSPEKIAPDLIDVVYGMVVKKGGQEGYESIKKLFLEADSDEVKVRCLRAMGKSDDVETAKKALDFMMSEDVKNQDKIYLFVQTSFRSVPYGRDIAWEFFKKEFDKFKEMFSGGMMMPYFVQYSFQAFDDEEIVEEIEEFFGKNSVTGCEMSIAKGLEAIKIKSKWIKKDKEKLVQWLKKTYGN